MSTDIRAFASCAWVSARFDGRRGWGGGAAEARRAPFASEVPRMAPSAMEGVDPVGR